MSDSRRCFRLVLVVLFLVPMALTVGVPTATAQPPSEPPAAGAGTAQDRASAADTDCPGGVGVGITVIPERQPLAVDPEVVEIFLDAAPGRPGRVCWTVSGLSEGETLHIRGKNPDNDLFPNLERRVDFPKTRANSGAPSRTGTWGYDLWITRAGDPGRQHFTDPEVIVRGGDSGDDGDGSGGGGGGRR